MNTNTVARPKQGDKANEFGSKNQSIVSEVDTLLWRIKARLEEKEDRGQVVAFTSCCRGSGVSTLIANIAVQAAKNQLGPILIIDANTTGPRQHKFFRHKTKVGLVDVLVGDIPPHEAIFPTSVPTLDIMPTGVPSLLESSRVVGGNSEELFHWARERYALILVDLPCISEMRHGLMIARQAEMTLVSIRSNVVRRSDAVQDIERLIADGVQVAGTILSRQTIFTPKFFRS